MRYAYAVADIRRLEAEAAETAQRLAPGGGDEPLMQRAAHGLAVRAAALLSRQRGAVYGAGVTVVVGPGNNGGDALFAGAHLAQRGCRVTMIAALGEPHPAGRRALAAAGGRAGTLADLDDTALRRADLVLDGVLGIGGRAGLPADLTPLAERRRDGGAPPVLAVDLPSGVEADTGAVPDAAFTAHTTVSFGTYKAAHLLEPARSRSGSIELVDIGLDTDRAIPALRAWEAADVAAAWPVPGPTDDKYSRGVVGVATGSERYPGAAVLSVFGAVHGGAGMVRFLGPDAARPVLLERLPNVVYGEGRVQSWLLGSGWGEQRDGRRRVADVLATGLPVVLDADALGHLPDTLPPYALLTPHAGELARLLGRERTAVTADPVGAVREAADRTGATVLLKGASQLVAVPGEPTVDVAVPGPAWTGQAGSGDTLGGLCAALLAAGRPAREAAALAASLQAMTAAAHPGPLPPQELAVRFAATIGEWGTAT